MSKTSTAVPTEPLKPMNLRQKLAYVRRTIRNIERKGRNESQNYDFMRAEDVAGDIGDMLAELNVVVLRENLSITQQVIEVQRFDYKSKQMRTAKDMHTLVILDYVFCDGDSDERLRIASAGEGRDSGDKSLPKAFTNALKYALTQVLLMRVGDDPEAVSEHDKDSGVAVPPPANADAFVTELQRRKLMAEGKKKMADAFVGWLQGRFAELKIPDKEHLTVGQMAALMREIELYGRGEESQEPAQSEEFF